jgi:hypothetical protein
MTIVLGLIGGDTTDILWRWHGFVVGVNYGPVHGPKAGLGLLVCKQNIAKDDAAERAKLAEGIHLLIWSSIDLYRFAVRLSRVLGGNKYLTCMVLQTFQPAQGSRYLLDVHGILLIASVTLIDMLDGSERQGSETVDRDTQRYDSKPKTTT